MECCEISASRQERETEWAWSLAGTEEVKNDNQLEPKERPLKYDSGSCRKKKNNSDEIQREEIKNVGNKKMNKNETEGEEGEKEKREKRRWKGKNPKGTERKGDLSEEKMGNVVMPSKWERVKEQKKEVSRGKHKGKWRKVQKGEDWMIGGRGEMRWEGRGGRAEQKVLIEM